MKRARNTRRLHWARDLETSATLCGSWGAPHLAATRERINCLSCLRVLDARQDDTPKGAA